MGLLTKIRRQPILIWTPLGKDKFGKQTFSLPSKFNARVESTSEEIIDDSGKKQITQKVIFIEYNVKPGCFMSEVVDDNMMIEESPDTNEFCNKIIKSLVIPKIRYDKVLYMSYI